MIRGRIAPWAALLLGALLLLPLRTAEAHPLHTTITDLSFAGGRVQAVIRIFSDDLNAAVAASGRTREAYLGRNFVLRGADGKQIPLRWRGTRLTEDLLWIHLEGSAAGLRGGTVANTLAADLFSDQVNIVKASYDGQKRTLLFTPGARPQRLP